jgi:hypothetical protein
MVAQVKECGRPMDMVIIEVGKRYHVVVVPSRCPQVVFECGCQIDALIGRIVRVSSVAVVEQKLLAVRKVDAAAVRVTDGEKVALCIGPPAGTLPAD